MFALEFSWCAQKRKNIPVFQTNLKMRAFKMDFSNLLPLIFKDKDKVINRHKKGKEFDNLLEITQNTHIEHWDKPAMGVYA